MIWRDEMQVRTVGGFQKNLDFYLFRVSREMRMADTTDRKMEIIRNMGGVQRGIFSVLEGLEEKK